MQEPTAEERQAAADAFKRFLKMPHAERAAAINSGMFNSFIEAYLVLTLYSMNAPKQKIVLAKGVLKDILDDTPAEAAADIANDIMQKIF